MLVLDVGTALGAAAAVATTITEEEGPGGIRLVCKLVRRGSLKDHKLVQPELYELLERLWPACSHEASLCRTASEASVAELVATDSLRCSAHVW